MPMLSLTAHVSLQSLYRLSAALRIRQHTQWQATQLLTDGIVRLWSGGVDQLVQFLLHEL